MHTHPFISIRISIDRGIGTTAIYGTWKLQNHIHNPISRDLLSDVAFPSTYLGEALAHLTTDDSFEQGLAQMERGQLNDALEKFRDALLHMDGKEDPDRWLLIQAQLGETLFRLNHVEDAETHLEIAANGGILESLVTLAVIAERDDDVHLATARRVLAAARGDIESRTWLETRT